MTLRIVEPQGLGRPHGYSQGMLATGNGRLLFVSGQIGWDAHEKIVSPELTAQFAQALDNVLAVVSTAGGGPSHVARMTIYVVDKQDYRTHAKAIGEAYRARMGKHFPAMTLVEVKSLLEDAAKVEIEVTAVLPA